MTFRELNLKLLEAIPEIKAQYDEETSWQDGDETGSHIVFEDVLTPFVKLHLCEKSERICQRIFDFLEELLETEDGYAEKVIVLSVLESLIFDEDVEKRYLLSFAKSKTLHQFEMLLS